jgi:hypothetical protein
MKWKHRHISRLGKCLIDLQHFVHKFAISFFICTSANVCQHQTLKKTIACVNQYIIIYLLFCAVNRVTYMYQPIQWTLNIYLEYNVLIAHFVTTVAYISTTLCIYLYKPCWFAQLLNKSIRHLPSRLMCLCFHFIQAAILDYYLVIYKGHPWLICIAADVVVAIVFVMCFYFSYKYLKHAQTWGVENVTVSDSGNLPMSPVAWFLYATLVSIKTGICFKDFVQKRPSILYES